MDALRTKDVNWHFYAVLALAANDEEAQKFRIMIKQTIANEEYKNIVVIGDRCAFHTSWTGGV